MKKIIIALILMLGYFTTSCTNNSINIEGKIEGYDLNGETAYLYFFVSAADIDPVYLAETSISNNSFSFKDLEKLEALQGKNLPIIALITLKDKHIQEAEKSMNPLASIILEQGNIKVAFKDTAVEISGTPKNNEFNKIQLAITNIADFASKSIELGSITLLPADSEGRDGEAQYQHLMTAYKDVTYNFTKNNMSNSVGEFLFYRHAQSIFTPLQMKELIDLGTKTFKDSPEIKQLSNILEQMKQGILPPQMSPEDDPMDDFDLGELPKTQLTQDTFDIVLEEKQLK